MDEESREPKQADTQAAREDAHPPRNEGFGHIRNDYGQSEETKHNPDKARKFPKIFKKPENVGFDRIVELFFSGAIVMLAGCQYLAIVSNNQSTTQQVSGLLNATNSIQASANSFSESASDINSGIDDAVGQLGDQVQKMDDARQSSDAAAQNALQATVDNFHRDERAWLGFGNLNVTLNKTDPIQATTTAIVLGKSPATHIETRLGFKTLAASYALQTVDLVLDPRVIKNGTIIPGGGFPLFEKANDPISDSDKAVVDAISDKRVILYFYGETTYKDVFHKPHWAHFCYAVTSSDIRKDAPCPIYNDSDADADRPKPIDIPH